MNEKPEIGLPTADTSGDKKGTFALLKRQMRLKRMATDDPNFAYLVETIANLARGIKNPLGQSTRHMLDPET